MPFSENNEIHSVETVNSPISCGCGTALHIMMDIFVITIVKNNDRN